MTIGEAERLFRSGSRASRRTRTPMDISLRRVPSGGTIAAGTIVLLDSRLHSDRRGDPHHVRDELLERLAAAGIAQPRPDRFHRFAWAVAEKTVHIAKQSATLRTMAEAGFELLQPRGEPSEPLRRDGIEHREAAYRNQAGSTMSSEVISTDLVRRPTDSTK
jgi:hypothetical protein